MLSLEPEEVIDVDVDVDVDMDVDVDVDADVDVDVDVREGEREVAGVRMRFWRCPRKTRTPHLGCGEEN